MCPHKDRAKRKERGLKLKVIKRNGGGNSSERSIIYPLRRRKEVEKEGKLHGFHNI